MKTIGLIGGMSWESSIVYYQRLNEAVREKMGGLHSAKVILFSLDFAEVASLQHDGQWEELRNVLTHAASQLENAGAEVIAIATNTMHVLADEVQAAIGVPLIHIAEATAKGIQQTKIQHVALLGTKFTMEGGFYRDYLENRHGLTVFIPEPEERDAVHRIIYQELCQGRVLEPSKATLVQIIDNFAKKGVEGIILGCTELPLILKQEDVSVRLFDTMALHADSILAESLSCSKSVCA
jgi:aspartate racemase